MLHDRCLRRNGARHARALKFARRCHTTTAQCEEWGMAEPTDDALLLAARGDADAFAAFYRRHARPLAGYFLRRTRDPETAADLTAETFAAALGSLRSFDPDRGPALGWLYGIAANQLAGSRRRGGVEDRARRRLGLERIALDDEELARFEQVATAEAAGVDVLIEELPPAQRAAVRARVIDERPYAEIAAEHGASEPTMRQRVARGLATLRTRLTEDEP